MEEIIAGDFVLLNKPDARMVGLVHWVEAGRAHIWWHVRDTLIKPEIREDSRPTSELKVFDKYAYLIPDSMVVLRNEKFPGKVFRVREPERR
jgi:hypothetical protein